MRYVQLSEIGQGGMGRVHLVYDQLNQQRVALKEVLTFQDTQTNNTDTEQEFRTALVQEFQILASLRHPNIISVLDYGLTDDHLPYFTMEYLENAQPITEIIKDRPVRDKVNLIVQILRALVYLHRHNIIHRDLKPDNVLVVADTMSVKVLDFGLAQDQKIASPEEENLLAGTIAYIAPELLLGHSASVVSDLYAVGMIAYEILAGRYPYEFADISELLVHIAHTQIDIDELDIDLATNMLLSRLLDKDPMLRYRSARDALTRYREATSYDIQDDDITIVDSFLQTADLVGRDEEIRQLQSAWQHASKSLQTQYYLIGGKSGVGKSRLLDEFRIYALVRGGEVLRGQSVQEGSAPLQVWRNIARYLCLSNLATDYELSILKSLVPDIEKLVDRPVSDLPELDAQATLERLTQGIIDMLKNFGKPLLLMLQDLHWASDASLTMLQRISEEIHDLPIMIVGDYRDDEKPDLPAMIPTAQTIILNNLDKERITQLTEAMLGKIDAEYREPLVTSLHDSSEGNVFFVVELLRTMAQDVSFSQIGQQTISLDLFKGGISNIIRNRLDKIPSELQDLLVKAAVFGRKIDRDILEYLADDSSQVQRLLTTAAEFQVIEVRDEVYNFAHDKLRSGLINAIEAEQKPRIHQQVAEAIEAVYAEQIDLYAATLAYQWSVAEDMAKEAHYAAIAGRQLIERGDYNEAVTYLQRAVDLYKTVSIDDFELAKLHRLLGEAHFSARRLQEARHHLLQSVTLLSASVPQQTLLGLLSEVRKQMAHRFLPSQWSIKQGLEASKALEASRAYERLAHIFFFDNETVPLLYASLRSLNLAENVTNSPELVRAYGTIGNACALIPSYTLARFYAQKSEDVSEIVNDITADVWRHQMTGHYLASKGDHDIALERYQKAADMANEIGHVARWEENLTLIGMVEYAVGRYDAAAEHREIIYDHAIKTHNEQSIGWALLGKIEYAILQGRFEDAHNYFAEFAHVEDRMGLTEKIWMHGMKARLQAMQNNPQTQETAETALALMNQLSTPNAYYSQEGYTGIAEAFLMLLEYPSLSDANRSHLQQMLKRAMGGLRTFARTFPFARAHLKRIEAWKAYLENQPAKAEKFWAAALAETQKHSKRYEKALVYFDYGRFGIGADSPASMQEAHRIFEEIGASYYAERSQQPAKM